MFFSQNRCVRVKVVGHRIPTVCTFPDAPAEGCLAPSPVAEDEGRVDLVRIVENELPEGSHGSPAVSKQRIVSASLALIQDVSRRLLLLAGHDLAQSHSAQEHPAIAICILLAVLICLGNALRKVDALAVERTPVAPGLIQPELLIRNVLHRCCRRSVEEPLLVGRGIPLSQRLVQLLAVQCAGKQRGLHPERIPTLSFTTAQIGDRRVGAVEPPFGGSHGRAAGFGVRMLLVPLVR
mmetsp:Transcript_47240/g.110388  ORF Transcript_47240/g.110388 Transcript_47240/m.110388 type:complete len:237 (+) Transcript_47240:323-1033(+)